MSSYRSSLTLVVVIFMLLGGPLSAASPTGNTPPYAPGAGEGLSQPATLARSQTAPDTIVLVEEPNPANALARLESGELDIYTMSLNNPSLVQQIQNSANLDGYRSYGSYNELTFNPAGPIFSGTGKLNPFAIPRVREAMNWLVDRQYIAQTIMGGNALPRWLPINTASVDYTQLIDVARALEIEYSYNLERARQVIAQEMVALGATLVNGKWRYGGQPVEILILIRSEDDRRAIGDHVADQLEAIGFTTVRTYATATGASPIWLFSNPDDGLFHVYTGGWITQAVPRDLADNFAFFYTNLGLAFPLWQAYVNTPEFYDLAARLYNGQFATHEERHTMMAQALEWALEDSARIWLIDRSSVTARRTEVSYASDLYAGLTNSNLWAYTLRTSRVPGQVLNMASPSILTGACNPLGGANWIYDMSWIRSTGDFGVVTDPYTGLAWPQRIDRADVVMAEGLAIRQTLDWVNLAFAPEIVVPDDAWVDWDATAQRFLTAAEVHAQPQTALRKSVVYYPADLYQSVSWHDGSPFSIADVVLNMILTFDRAKPASAVYDPSTVAAYNDFMNSFRGVRILSQNPLVIETYSDRYALDAELSIDTWWPFYLHGPGAWHSLTIGLQAEAAGQGAFSQAKANQLNVQWLDYKWDFAGILGDQLAAAQAANAIPYAPTLASYVSGTQAAARWANFAQWYAAQGHFWLGTGPFYLTQPDTLQGTLTLRRYAGHPDDIDRWQFLAVSPEPQVVLQGPLQIQPGATATYNIHVTLDGQPYPAADIDVAHYWVSNSQGAIFLSGEPALVTDGLWRVVFPGSVTNQMPGGAIRLDVVVSSPNVAMPGSYTRLVVVPQAYQQYLPIMRR